MTDRGSEKGQLGSDNLAQIWKRFFDARTADSWHRFNGWFRAVVVETNDPLQFYRIRFKCPELHDWNLKPEECPWAVPSPSLGVRGSQFWSHPMIDDWVWIHWEKNNPFGPIWCGFATPTRRKFYALESVFTKSPLSVNEEGKKADKPDDYLEDYLSKDFRPYQYGWRDRYGSFFYFQSTGFFPKEHDKQPAPVGYDAIQKSEFEPKGSKPEMNDPDVKLLASCSKYGVYVLHSDVGYYWKKDKDGDLGEFKGDFDEDRPFEIKRSKYLRKHFNEQEPKDRDQRRYEVRTRYGHKIEMRDVGWAQKGPVKSKSRPDEYDEERRLSKEEKKDETWIKLRSKNGHLFQMYDKGVNYDKDTFIKRKIKEEIGGVPDQEDEYWQSKDDARWTRLLTRWGLKIVLDDRGVHYTEAEKHVKPRANGILLKGRRLVCEEDDGEGGLGFAFEFCEKKQLNKLSAYTPKSKILELNDKKDYVMLCSDMNTPISEPWQGLKGHEFALAMAMTYRPEDDTHHMKLDLKNEYLRLKTRAGHGQGSRGETGCEEPEQKFQALNAGLEARDGEKFGGCGETWVELVDQDERGLWFSHDKELTVLRARLAEFEGKPPKDMYYAMDEKQNAIVIFNGEKNGRIQIYCAKDVEIKAAKNLIIEAGDSVSIKAKTKFCVEAGGSHLLLSRNMLGTDAIFNAPRSNAVHTGCEEGSDAGPKSPVSCEPVPFEGITVNPLKPTDRGKVCNEPFDKQAESVLEKPDADAGESGR
ncbi:MAG: phage baseplate assembly protein V [Candidatus Nanopelagicaceae bacterium]|nr:phage baseplate assembly protein V [Candidatus Nanopelagicaceae bacterium]